MKLVISAFLLVILASYCLTKKLKCYKCEDSIANDDFRCQFTDEIPKWEKVDCEGSCFETHKFEPSKI